LGFAGQGLSFLLEFLFLGQFWLSAERSVVLAKFYEAFGISVRVERRTDLKFLFNHLTLPC